MWRTTDQRDRNADPTEKQLSVTDAIRKFLVGDCDVITEDSPSVRTHEDANEEDRSNHWNEKTRNETIWNLEYYDVVFSGGSRIFLGAPAPKMVLLQIFCRKLHEKERIWTPRGPSLASHWIRQWYCSVFVTPAHLQPARTNQGLFSSGWDGSTDPLFTEGGQRRIKYFQDGGANSKAPIKKLDR